MNARSCALLLAASLTACGEEAEEVGAGGAVIEVTDVGFQTPESVLHDTTADVYLVSNINGAPAEKDDNGFISAAELRHVMTAGALGLRIAWSIDNESSK